MLPSAQAASQGQFEPAALAGVLSTLYDLGYSLQSVKKVKPKEKQDVEKA